MFVENLLHNNHDIFNNLFSAVDILDNEGMLYVFIRIYTNIRRQEIHLDIACMNWNYSIFNKRTL